jgi:hypothetical protein
LVVAIDSYDELVETNEANNVKAYDRSSLAIVPATVPQTVEVDSTETEVLQEAVRPKSDPGDAMDSTPETPTADPLQSAIRMLGGQSGAASTTIAP